MKKIPLLVCLVLCTKQIMSQTYRIDFDTSNILYICNPPNYGTTNQHQCIDNVAYLTPIGNALVYTNTSAIAIGNDCRNHIELVNPGYTFIGVGSELQLRNANNGSVLQNPARFVIKNFPSTLKFGIVFDMALAGRGGSYYFRCGSGQAYGDTAYMPGRDSSSAVVIKINDENPALMNPYVGYSNAANNTLWPNVPSYSWQPGATILAEQKHEIALFCNNSPNPVTYYYLGNRTLSPSSYDVYIDSVLDAANVFDDFFQNGRMINSFMFGGGNSMCATGGPYLGDTLIIDNVRWTTDFVSTPLPVHFTRFTGSYKNGYVALDWRDENSSPGAETTVQISSDGSSFKWLASMNEQSSGSQAYNFTYRESRCGRYFYRLVRDGQYSSVVHVDIPCTYPLITVEQGSIHIDMKRSGSVTLSDIGGRRIFTRMLPSGTSVLPVQVPAGVYILQCFDALTGESVVKKIVQ